MNPSQETGSQPASGSGGLSNGGFEVIATGMAMGVSPPCSTVGALSMTDVTLEQALARMQELVRENTELREYLKENNEMMKKQFETLSQWKQKVHDANVMNREKFELTRSLITALRSENEELQAKVRNSSNSEDVLTCRIRSLEGELNTLKTAKMASDQFAYNVAKQAEKQGVDVGEEETQMRETVYVASAENEEKLMELESELERAKEEIEQLKDRSSHLEHDNLQFRSNTEQLLKDLEATQQLKQQIQKENQDLQQETVELRQQVQSMLAESKNSLQRNQKLAAIGMHKAGQDKDKCNLPIEGNTEEGEMGQTPYHTADDWQDQSGAVTAEVEQLRKQLQAEKRQVETLNTEIASCQLQISELRGQLDLQQGEMESLQTRNEERIRQLQREHESHIERISQQKSQDSAQQQHQMLEATHAEDVQTLRSQVLTLINEVHESMNKLQAANRTIESKTARVKELEAYNAQTVEESRSHIRQLQQALSMGENHLTTERQNHDHTKQQMNDLRKSFNQLVSDYKELLETFDQYKSEQEQRQNNPQNMDTISHLTAQVLAAEEAINMREERITKLQQDLREKDETVAVLQAQADVFKLDFMAERDARSGLATEKERLRQELESEQLKNQGLTDQLTRYTQQQLQDMQLRASQGDSSYAPFTYPPQNTPFPQRSSPFSTSQQSNKPYLQRNNPNPPHNNSPYPQHNYPQVSAANNPAGPAFRNTGNDNSGGIRGRGAGLNDLSGEGGGQGGMGFGGGGAGNYGTHYGSPHYPGQNYMVGSQPQQQQRQRAGSGHAQGGSGQAQPSQHDEEEQTQYYCPSCNHRLPDYDTLNIHVQECLDQNSGDGARN